MSFRLLKLISNSDLNELEFWREENLKRKVLLKATPYDIEVSRGEGREIEIQIYARLETNEDFVKDAIFSTDLHKQKLLIVLKEND